MAISDYLEKLNTLRNALADNLSTMGVIAKRKETLSELVPKVLEIPQGGGSGEGGVNNLFLSDSEKVLDFMPYGVDTVWISSDTLLSSSLSLSGFTTDAFTGISYVNQLLAKAEVDTSKVVKGSRFTLQAQAAAYLNKNGTSLRLSLPVRNTLEDFEGTSIGRKTLTSSYSDSGTYSIDLSKYKVHPFLTKNLSLAPVEVSALSLNGDSLMQCGDMKLYVNNRDNGYLNLYLLEVPMDDVGWMVRLTWDGYMPYSQDAKNRSSWEFSFYGNGDAQLHIVKYGESASTSGTFKLNDTSYTNPGSGGYLSIYRDDSAGTRFHFVNAQYDLTQHNKDCDQPYHTRTFEEMIADTDGMTIAMCEGADDQTFTLTNTSVPWPYKGTDRTSFYVSTNSWIGITGSGSEELKINRRDAYGITFYHQAYELSDLNNLKCYKIRWEGSSYYSSHSVDQIYEWYFFENGDAMLRLVKKGSKWDGTFGFFGTAFTISEGECVSFYRTNANSDGWTIVNETYDITKHLA